MKKIKVFAVMMVTAGLMASCSSMNKTQKGAVIGAGGGAVVGGAVGRAAGNTALGAIIGAAVGGTAGAVIGKRMDKQAEEIEQTVPGAKVERVGEGIVVEFGESVLFATNQSTLSTAAYNSLDKLNTILKKYPDTNLEIDGHTDSKGTDAYNQDLSERRAQAVANYIVAKGTTRSRISTMGYGERYPKYSNNTEEGRAGNRRVEFQISANERMKQDAQKEAQ
jgi:outer membrane protein OmpA-like peptidoglycan-associated protein